MTEYADNGWPVVGPDKIDASFAVAGVAFPGGLLRGNVSAVFRYLLGEIHARVEPLHPGWCWGYAQRDNVNSPGNPSTHATGTSVDVNAPDHANGAHGTWSSAQIAEIRQIMAECPAFLWGEDFTGTVDGMHFQIANNLDEADLGRIVANLPADQEDDMPLSSDDVNRIAAEVMDRMRNEKVIDMLVYDDDGTEDTELASITRTLQSAQTQAARANH